MVNGLVLDVTQPLLVIIVPSNVIVVMFPLDSTVDQMSMALQGVSVDHGIHLPHKHVLVCFVPHLST